MRVIRAFPILGWAVISMMAMAHHAQAVIATQIETGNSITYDGLTFTITGCAYSVAGSSTACGPSGLNGELEAIDSVGGADLELLSAGSGPLISLAAPANPNANSYDDLILNISVTPAAASSGTTVTSLTTAVTGSAPTTAEQKNISVRTTFNAPSAYDLTTYVGGAASTQSFAPTMPLQLTYDLRVSAVYGTSPADVLSLANARLIYSPAPEPASIALLLSGLGGMVAVRRRFKRGSKSDVAT